MRAVVQEDETRCGLACVAMVVGEPYHRVWAAAASLGIAPTDEALWIRPMLGRCWRIAW